MLKVVFSLQNIRIRASRLTAPTLRNSWIRQNIRWVKWNLGTTQPGQGAVKALLICLQHKSLCHIIKFEQTPANEERAERTQSKAEDSVSVSGSEHLLHISYRYSINSAIKCFLKISSIVQLVPDHFSSIKSLSASLFVSTLLICLDRQWQRIPIIIHESVFWGCVSSCIN